jgi:hypothetical protein
MLTVMIDEASELTSEQSAKILKEELIEHLKLIKTNFSDGYVTGACGGKTTICHPRLVEWEGVGSFGRQGISFVVGSSWKL